MKRVDNEGQNSGQPKANLISRSFSGDVLIITMFVSEQLKREKSGKRWRSPRKPPLEAWETKKEEEKADRLG
jgi:hypothetical protein